MNSNKKIKTFFTTGLVLLFTVFAANSLQAQQSADANIGVLAFESTTIDYGAVEHKANGLRTFKFTNTGKSPVVIVDVKTSCGCTVATKPTKPILPGESSEISVKYATNRVGNFTKSITVISNARESRKVLKIKGKVLPANTKV